MTASMNSQFRPGQPVRVKHQPDLGVCEVTSIEPTDMVFWTRRKGHGLYQPLIQAPVGHYVRIKSDRKAGMGYHEESLEAA